MKAKARSGTDSSSPQPLPPEISVTEMWRCRLGASPKQQIDQVAKEEPLEIRVRGRSVAVTMRTPGHDQELAAGFLLTEGLIKTRGDVLEMSSCQRGAASENTLDIFLAASVEVNFKQLTRHVFAASSCGLFGKATIEAVH